MWKEDGKHHTHRQQRNVQNQDMLPAEII